MGVFLTKKGNPRDAGKGVGSGRPTARGGVLAAKKYQYAEDLAKLGKGLVWRVAGGLENSLVNE